VSLSEANCNVRQSHSIFAENIRIARLATLTALGENIYRGDSEKITDMTAAKKTSRQNACAHDQRSDPMALVGDLVWSHH